MQLRIDDWENQVLLRHLQSVLEELDDRVDYYSRRAERLAEEWVLPIEEYHRIRQRADKRQALIRETFNTRRLLRGRMRRLWQWPLPVRACRLIESYIWG
jgi:hypothetical protein